jgi:hypothetical protein
MPYEVIREKLRDVTEIIRREPFSYSSYKSGFGCSFVMLPLLPMAFLGF